MAGATGGIEPLGGRPSRSGGSSHCLARNARAVLGWDAVREVEARFGAVPLRGVLRRAIRRGIVDAQPLRPLALMLMGALSEACLYVADSDDPAAAAA